MSDNSLTIIANATYKHSTDTRIKTMADKKEAIDLPRDVVEAGSGCQPDLALFWDELRSQVGDRFVLTGAMADLEEAISVITQAVKAIPQDHPDRAMYLSSLGMRLGNRFECTGSLTDLEEAIDVARQAVAAAPLTHPDLSTFWSNLGTLQAGQDPISAIQLLETGRGVLASSLHDLRTDISSLRDQHHSLAQSFDELRHILDTPASRSIADQRHKASQQMSMLLAKIRSLSGFERFLLPATEVEMCQAAEAGPIVIANVSSHRYDAFIIEACRIRALELPGLSRELVLAHAKDVQSLETLQWLWDVVVEPVLEALCLTRCPAVDPWLACAGYHQEPGGKTALDRVVSSYSSTVKTIIHTRQQRQDVRPKSAKIVLVSMQQTPGQNQLQYADKEIHAAETLSALESCQIFRFAGHGGADLDPLKSRLYLEDWQNNLLTVGSLLERKLHSGSPFLAYLSACKTSENLDEVSADESLHLTSAFQLAGFQYVISTLWEFLGDNGLNSSSVSSGLHYAARAFRDEWVQKENGRGQQVDDQGVILGIKPARDVELCEDFEPSQPLWVPYVHYGV
ncbi:TPR domain-containing protein [Dactylonectria macrodidyma]|uniref:TPR domain-containing protein n=1 Tax=Dactylonectria macrodidyma TaxID=307937 RepID=A0A9P9FL12_9HYPO|nr:TPR domain-containing protein [Dactylonectria macrodidyma]